MKVGIWLDESINPTVGGGFSYTDKLIDFIDTFDFHEALEIVFVTTSTLERVFNKPIIQLKPKILKELSLKQKVLSFLSKRKIISKEYYITIKKRNVLNTNNYYKAQLKSNQIDIIYYLSQQKRVIEDFPFISTNWDLGHLSMPSFPEVISTKDFRNRQNWYNHSIQQAISIFVESQAGKKELIHYLNINSDKIKVLPIFSGGVCNQSLTKIEQQTILKKYSLKEQSFFFYPAQFWAHKNHSNLITAFKRFSIKFPDVKLVFTGSDKGNLDYILKRIEEENLTEKVSYLGFVDLDIIYALYKNAIALVMPTFLGPTNMPLLEARDLGCPVLCSDLRGHREQLNDGALYFNPFEEDSIFNALSEIMDLKTRELILIKAKEDLETTIFKAEKAVNILEKHLIEISKFRKCWN